MPKNGTVASREVLLSKRTPCFSPDVMFAVFLPQTSLISLKIIVTYSAVVHTAVYTVGSKTRFVSGATCFCVGNCADRVPRQPVALVADINSRSYFPLRVPGD